MSVNRRFTHTVSRLGLSAAATAATLALLAACGTSSDSGAPATVAGQKTGTAPAAPTAVPTQDVVSSVQADATLKAELPASVRRRGTLTLGTTLAPGTAGLPLTGQISGGKDIGLEVDVRNAVARILGLRWNVQNATFPTIIPGVQNGKFDVGQDDFSITGDREKVIDYATYLSDGEAFLGAGDVKLDAVRHITDLCGLVVATNPGTAFQQILTQSAGKCRTAGKSPYEVQYFTDNAPIYLGLANGKVDIYFGPTLSLKYDSTHVPNTKFLGQLSSTPVGFITAKGSPITKVLSDAVNKLIADGTYAKILTKWGVGRIGISKSLVNPPATL